MTCIQPEDADKALTVHHHMRWGMKPFGSSVEMVFESPGVPLSIGHVWGQAAVPESICDETGGLSHLRTARPSSNLLREKIAELNLRPNP